MGVLIHMDSKELMKTFLPAIEDQSKFQFIVISDTITTTEKLKNVKSIKRLIPPQPSLRAWMQDGEEEFLKSYGSYLAHPGTEPLLTVIAKAVIVNNLNIVLLSSVFERECNYIKAIADYMEATYEIDTCSVKQYLKNPEKYDNRDNVETATAIITKKLESIDENDLRTSDTKEDQIKNLKKLKRKEIKAMAKREGLKLNKDLDKKDMIKKLIKYRRQLA